MSNAGYEVSVATVDASSPDDVHALVEKATSLGDVTGLIHAAGVSPSQASPETILRVDLYGTALVLFTGRRLVPSKTKLRPRFQKVIFLLHTCLVHGPLWFFSCVDFSHSLK
jgi:hypothetical protein